MTRFDSPRLVQYGGLAAVGLLAGLVLGRVELVAVAAPFALACVAGAALARHPEVTGDAGARARARARGRRRSRDDHALVARRRRPRRRLPPAPGRAARAGGQSARGAARGGRGARARAQPALRALGCVPARPGARPRPRSARLPLVGGARRRRAAAARVPERGDGAHDAGAARDAGVRRQPGLAGARRRHRVRRPARVGAGRPRARASTGVRARAATCSG